MTTIDCSDCYLTVRIGQRTRLSLYNHMRAFLCDAIRQKGFSVDDLQLFNMLTIEERAMDASGGGDQGYRGIRR